MARTAETSFSLPQSLVAAFETNDRITRYLIENLPGCMEREATGWERANSGRHRCSYP